VNCGHDEVCSDCHLRQRYLYSTDACVVCKVDNPKVIVPTPLDSSRTAYDEFQVWDNDMGSAYTYHEDSSMFFPKAFFDNFVKSLFEENCGICTWKAKNSDAQAASKGAASNDRNSNEPTNYDQNHPPRTLRPLLQHVNEKHGLTFCVLCYCNKRDYLSLLPRVTPAQLSSHMLTGDGSGSGFTGHSKCEFCSLWFYDLAALHSHLNKTHYKCHICKQGGSDNQFFRDYRKLERHFDRRHFLCPDEECKMMRFVAFPTEMAYQLHMKQMHHRTHGGDSKIQLAFRVKRSGFTGEGYDEDQGDFSNNDGDFPAFGGGFNPSQRQRQGGGRGGRGADEGAFVPEALPEQQGGQAMDEGAADTAQDGEVEISDPVHRERTERMREEARKIRERVEREEEYPELGGGGG
ncbi:hypothetical protein TrRE_jg11215, partial [Triparma retinervis]